MELKNIINTKYQTIVSYTNYGVKFRSGIFYKKSFLVSPTIDPIFWSINGYNFLTKKDFIHISKFNPSIVILGTGGVQHFIHPKLTYILTQKNIGIECMNNQAACRTYNILVSDDIKVMLALIFD